MEKQEIRKPLGQVVQGRPAQTGANKPFAKRFGTPANRPASSAQGGQNQKRQHRGGKSFRRPERNAIGQQWSAAATAIKPMDWKPEDTLKIIPLGGCEEVGRNMTVFEYGQDIVILDMGLQFPEEDMPGIDYVIPNTEYLKGKEKNIKAVIFSHGHLDHIGAAAILLKKLDGPPIIGRPLTLEMIKHRLEDSDKGSSKKLNATIIKSLEDKIDLGNFKLSFFAIDHTIMDAVGVILETPVATVIHPGDWSIEKDPVGRDMIHYSQLANLKRPTILMLEALGSTNSKTPVTGQEMLDNIKKLIGGAPGRTIIATFSSQIERIKQILEIAAHTGKKVALDGFSMKMNIELATNLGYIIVPKGVVIPVDKIKEYPDNKVIVICTGAQGEEMSALPRIIAGNHKYISIKKEDTVIFSSSVIPGNERTVQRVKDNVYRLSDNVYHNDIMNVHVSGHSNIDGIKQMLSEVKPDYFIPVYGNHFMLKECARIGWSMGILKHKVFVPDNGSVIKFTKTSAEVLKEKVPSSYVFVDGLGVGDVGEIVLRDRQALSQDGMFVIVAIIDSKTGKVKGSPDIISRGFVYLRESKDLLSQTRKKAIEIIEKSSGHGQQNPINWSYVKEEIRNKVGDFLATKTSRRPMVLPVVIEV
ncbi:MAG: ribonuclease J [Candidatus Staskawiczbacteria bacterium]|nr:ribonuclease J [Candidatus Staskawiczbacteria bacterium]